MRTFDVTLPSKKKIVFPPRCVVCEAENPAGKLSLSFLGATSLSVSTMAVDAALDSFDPKYYSIAFNERRLVEPNSTSLFPVYFINIFPVKVL